MSALMHPTASVGPSPAQELPADLRSWLPSGRVLTLAIEAAGVVTKDPAFRHPCFEKFHAPMMLALFGYCYAANYCGSQDVEWTVLNEAQVRHLCGSVLPDAQAIRRFRRAYRPWILQCLVCLLKEAIAEHAEKGEAVYIGTSVNMVEWASRKIQLAILMDAAAAD